MQPYGFPREKHAFRPHLTIGRVKDGRILEILRGLTAQPFAAMPASFHEMTFMRSELHPTGARYTPLHTFRLAPPGMPGHLALPP